MVEVVEHFGVMLELDPSYMSDHMMDVIRRKRYETPEAKQIDRIVQDNEVVLEIGAGIGFVSSLIAKHPLTKKIVSYEANPVLIDKISKTVERTVKNSASKWSIKNAVLLNGFAEPTIDFYVHKDFWASSLSPIADAIRVEKVAVENFNAVLADLRPTMIVCDIEGGELALFKNADLSSVKKVYVEIHQKRLGRRGIKALFEAFHARDFAYDQHHSDGSVVLFSHVDRDKK